MNRPPSRANWPLVLGFWLFVGLPLAWGIYRSLLQASQLFH